MARLHLDLPAQFQFETKLNVRVNDLKLWCACW